MAAVQRLERRARPARRPRRSTRDEQRARDARGDRGRRAARAGGDGRAAAGRGRRRRVGQRRRLGGRRLGRRRLGPAAARSAADGVGGGGAAAASPAAWLPRSSVAVRVVVPVVGRRAGRRVESGAVVVSTARSASAYWPRLQRRARPAPSSAAREVDVRRRADARPPCSACQIVAGNVAAGDGDAVDVRHRDLAAADSRPRPSPRGSACSRRTTRRRSCRSSRSCPRPAGRSRRRRRCRPSMFCSSIFVTSSATQSGITRRALRLAPAGVVSDLAVREHDLADRHRLRVDPARGERRVRGGHVERRHGDRAEAHRRHVRAVRVSGVRTPSPCAISATFSGPTSSVSWA